MILYINNADWGVDFIKNDCVYANYVPDQIEAVSAAIDHSGRQMFYSLSPGMADPPSANVISPYVNMYRITGDTWDRWGDMPDHFSAALTMQAFIAYPKGRYGFKAYPDLDMLPLGYIGIEGVNQPPQRMCRLTMDEQYTLLSLWMIFRAPLMYGGDLTHPDPFSLGLITNTEALTINSNSMNNKNVYSNSTTSLWRADSDQWQTDGISYFSITNLSDNPVTLPVTTAQVRGEQAAGTCNIRDIWGRQDVGTGSTFNIKLPLHGSGLYSLRECSGVIDQNPPTIQLYR